MKRPKFSHSNFLTKDFSLEEELAKKWRNAGPFQRANRPWNGGWLRREFMLEKIDSSANCPDFTVEVGDVITCIPSWSFLHGHLRVQKSSENHHIYVRYQQRGVTVIKTSTEPLGKNLTQ